MAKTVLERFEEKYEKQENGCWLWRAGKKTLGYGAFNAFGEQYAHRVSYLLYKGSIPSGLVLDHLCRNPSCVNPDHIEAVTQGENVRRGLASEVARRNLNSQKTHCWRGHLLVAPNLIRVSSRKKRRCRECENMVRRKAYKEARPC